MRISKAKAKAKRHRAYKKRRTKLQMQHEHDIWLADRVASVVVRRMSEISDFQLARNIVNDLMKRIGSALYYASSDERGK